MATTADLVSKLKLRASIPSTERLSPILSAQDDLLAELISEAVKEHNPNYTISSLPAAEESLVLILAHIEVCYIRASMVVNAAPIQSTGNNFTLAIDSPFKKNMDLAIKLKNRYDSLVLKLGVTSVVGTVIAQTTVYKKSDRLDILFPLFNVPAAPAATLYAEAINPTTVKIHWDHTPVDYFSRNFLFWCLTPGIYADWNSVGVMTVPRIKSSASLFFDSTDQTRDVVEAEPFPSNTDLYFMLVTKTQQNKFTYSDEVMVHTPA